MPQHPAAFVPSTAAAGDLLKIAKSLRLVADGVEVNRAIDGSRMVISTSSSNRFPATLNPTTHKVTLPPLWVDFFDWFYFATQEISDAPSTGTHWLRCVITAQFIVDGALVTTQPIDCTVSTPTFDWFDTVNETVTPPNTDPDPPIGGVDVDYFFYLVKITDNSIVDTFPSCYITGWPLEVPPPP